MRLTYPGHSQLLVHMDNPDGRTVNLLVDSWMSDYSVGDYLERRPHVRVDHAKCPVDAVFLSHAHCDHLDPYFLRELWQHQRPAVLLAETLDYLRPLLEENLPGSRILSVRDQDELGFMGLSLHGMVWQDEARGPEEDVMTLCVDNGREALYHEIDAVPNGVPDDEDYLHWLLTRKKFETVAYVATRNELEGLLTALDCRNQDERRAFVRDYRKRAKQDVLSQYDAFAEQGGPGYADVTAIPGFVRLFVGQGMAYPSKAEPELSKVRPLQLQDLALMEREAAAATKRKFPQHALEAGKTYEVSKGGILAESAPATGLVFGHPLPPADNAVDARRAYLPGPLDPAPRDRDAQEALVMDLLKNRFTPYWLGHADRPLKNGVLSKTNRAYVVAVRYGDEREFSTRYYNFALGTGRFEAADQGADAVDEDYWANDLQDFYEGRQEPNSNFLHALDPAKTYLLWTCLGASFLNNDVVERKHRLHFERARRGLGADSWVLPAYEKRPRRP